MRTRTSSAVLFLVPGGIAIALTFWVPFFYAIYISFQQYDLFSRAKWVGLDNYRRVLLTDPLWGTSMVNSLEYAVERVLATVVVWRILQGAWLSGRRVPTTLVLASIAPLPFITPAGTSLVWRLLADGPLRSLVPLRSSPEAAQPFLLVLDCLHTLAIAAAFGLVVYALSQKPWHQGMPNHPDYLALQALIRRQVIPKPAGPSEVLAVTGRIAILISAASGLQSFAWSYLITSGGPAYSTVTPTLLVYWDEFRYSQFGYGAALSTIVLLILLALGIGVWTVLRALPLQLVRVRAEDRSSGGTKTAPGVLALLGVAPAVVVLMPIVWLFWYRGASGVPTQLPWVQWWLNGLLVPGLAVFLVQVPVAYLAAVGLVLTSTSSPRAARWLMLPFVVASLAGVGVVSGPLYVGVAALRGLNESGALAVPLAWSGATAGSFLIYVTGYSSRLALASLREGSVVRTIQESVWPAIKPLALIAGLTGTYWASQEVFWSGAALTEVKSFTPGLGLIFASGQPAFATSWAILIPILAGAAVTTAVLVFLARALIMQFALETS